MGWVEGEDIEDFDGARLGREGLDVVSSDLKVVKESIGGSEAVGQLDELLLTLNLVITELVVESVDETESEGTSSVSSQGTDTWNSNGD